MFFDVSDNFWESFFVWLFLFFSVIIDDTIIDRERLIVIQFIGDA